MLNLVYKDLLMMKKQLLFGWIYILVIIVSFQSIGEAMFATGVVAFTYMLALTACAYEDKNKADVLLNCLPVKRNRIVLAKYLSTLIFFALGMLFYTVTSAIIEMAGVPLKTYSISWEGFVGALVAICILQGVYYPVFFKVGYIKSKIVNLIVFFSVFFGFSYLAREIQESGLQGWMQQINVYAQQHTSFSVAMATVCVLLLLLVSYTISVIFYNRREF